jgi:DDE_Tnp_1-associated
LPRLGRDEAEVCETGTSYGSPAHVGDAGGTSGQGYSKVSEGEKKRVTSDTRAEQENQLEKRMTEMDYSTLVAEEENRLSRVPLTALYEALKQVKDGRKKRGRRSWLALILRLLLLARLAGETDMRAAAQWIRLRKKWIIEQLHLSRGSVPCLGTNVCVRGFRKMDAQDLLRVVAGCVTRWEGQERCENEPSRLADHGGKQSKEHVAVLAKICSLRSM